MRRLLMAATLAATVTFAIGIASPAFADGDPTMDQIYTAAAGGHLDQAQQMITQVLADHPTSAKAHYVQAELYAKEGKTGLARSELATAEQLKPGLPFANPRSVQELKAQLGLRVGAVSPTVIRSVPAEPRFPWRTVLILAAVVGILWLLFRRRSGGGGVIPPAEAGDSGFSNSDMGGSDFGVNDPGSGWDDGGSGGGGGDDWS